MKIFKVIVVLLFLLNLTSCWDSIQLEESAYVVAVGLDIGENGGVSVTYQIANPQVGSSDLGKAENEEPTSVITLEAPDFVSAQELANVSVSRAISFTHTKVFIISEEYAKSGEMVNLVDAFVRTPKISTNINIIVCKEKAKDFIEKNKPPLETRPHKNYVFMTERWAETGLVPLSTVERYLQRIEGKCEAFLSIYATAEKEEAKKDGKEDEYQAGEVKKEGDNPVQMIGAAVIREGKMVGILSGEEVRLVLLMRTTSQATDWIATYDDPLEEGSHVTATLKKPKPPEITLDLNKPVPEIDVKIKADIELSYIKSNINYGTDLNKQKELEKSIEKGLTEKMDKLLERSQKELKIDLFQFDLKARQKFWTLKTYDSFKWKEKYQKAKINVEFDITIVDLGRQVEPVEEINEQLKE